MSILGYKNLQLSMSLKNYSHCNLKKCKCATVALGLVFPIHFHKGPPVSPTQESELLYLISLSLTLTCRNLGHNGHFGLALGFLRLPL